MIRGVLDLWHRHLWVIFLYRKRNNQKRGGAWIEVLTPQPRIPLTMRQLLRSKRLMKLTTTMAMQMKMDPLLVKQKKSPNSRLKQICQ